MYFFDLFFTSNVYSQANKFVIRYILSSNIDSCITELTDRYRSFDSDSNFLYMRSLTYEGRPAFGISIYYKSYMWMNSQIIGLIKNSNRYVELSNGVKLKILDDNDVEFALYHLDKNGRPFFQVLSPNGSWEVILNDKNGKVVHKNW